MKCQTKGCNRDAEETVAFEGDPLCPPVEGRLLEVHCSEHAAAEVEAHDSETQRVERYAL